MPVADSNFWAGELSMRSSRLERTVQTEYLLVQEQELQYCRDVEIFYVFNCVIEVLTKLAAAMKKTRRPVNETR
ncbi:hypothetical protein PC119_g9368 [Phytophthora cactorum]|uniref:Uncharacterized protein n=1 Tax=Phytophthora cactorum TaxID=29920 RepID=A0A8T0YRZ9_9STRA|nr:hypothetical protein PC113_g14190 [Phytophthora cactorum]KAG2897189.1 hypothetical protein PC114_g14783 [Phytophthora cactorum]KAG2909424.1 hypothetical protein PC115_g13261 [Phytophthora cactorum]KAG3022226.1 hypothetical protein PC119_g9368 [Phytophthora cactorum]KAG3087735.1 hypothetical protein PC122_g8722 [Phytophthora cactorum]